MKKRSPAPIRPSRPLAGRLPVVGVMGSGTRTHDGLAAPLGRGLARMGVHLLTGGGGGVMTAVSRAFARVEDRAGLVVGVLPGGVGDGRGNGGERGGTELAGPPPPGYPNPWVELAIRTHLAARGAAGDTPDSRNHVNVLSSDVVVALPGGAGTASEVELALRYGRPLVVLGVAEGAAERAAPGTGRVHATNQVSQALSLVRRLLHEATGQRAASGQPAAADQPAASGAASSSSHD